MKFRHGQEVTPKENREFFVVFGNFESKHLPKFGKVYTVREYPPQLVGTIYKNWMSLCELPSTSIFNEDSFELVIHSDQLEQDLWEVQIMGERLADG